MGRVLSAYHVCDFSRFGHFEGLELSKNLGLVFMFFLRQKQRSYFSIIKYCSFIDYAVSEFLMIKLSGSFPLGESKSVK